MEKNKILIYFSWVITISAFIFIYGGFHPDKIAKGRILNFSIFLVVIAHIPSAFSLLSQVAKKVFSYKDALLLLISIAIQLVILGR
jgi:hypothetical protein